MPGEVKLIASRSESESEQGDNNKSGAADPKPGELSMARLKRG